MTFAPESDILLRPGPFRSFGGCPFWGIHGRQETAQPKGWAVFLCHPPSALLQQNRGAEFSEVNPIYGPRPAFSWQVYNPENVNSILLQNLAGRQPTAHPAERNKTSVILLRSINAGAKMRRRMKWLPLLTEAASGLGKMAVWRSMFRHQVPFLQILDNSEKSAFTYDEENSKI